MVELWAVAAGPGRSLLMGDEVIVVGGDIVTDLHFVEEPVWIAVKDFSQMGSNVAGGLAEAVHNSAQRRFMDAQHACEAVLTDAGDIHAQLQIGIDVSIQGHGAGLFSSVMQGPAASYAGLSMLDLQAIGLPNPESLFVNILLINWGRLFPEEYPLFPKYKKICGRALPEAGLGNIEPVPNYQ